MYKELDKKFFIQGFNFPKNYKVDGYLQFGSYDVGKQVYVLEEILKKLKIKYEIKRLFGFLQNIFELKIKKKMYWFGVVYGGSITSEYIHIASLLGSKKNIHLGSCGGLNKNEQEHSGLP